MSLTTIFMQIVNYQEAANQVEIPRQNNTVPVTTRPRHGGQLCFYDDFDQKNTKKILNN